MTFPNDSEILRATLGLRQRLARCRELYVVIIVQLHGHELSQRELLDIIVMLQRAIAILEREMAKGASRLQQDPDPEANAPAAAVYEEAGQATTLVQQELPATL